MLRPVSHLILITLINGVAGTLLVLPATAQVDQPASVTYWDSAGHQDIFNFAVKNNSPNHLYVNYWDGSGWHWADQGLPSGIAALPFQRPAAITYSNPNGRQVIFAFVVGPNGHLYVNYWDGFRWNWADQGLLVPAIRHFAPGGPAAVLDYLGDGRLDAAAALSLRNSGTLVIVGSGPGPLALPTAVLMVRGVRVIGSRSCIRRDPQELIELVAAGRLKTADLTSHHIPLADVNEAVEEIETRRQGAWLINIRVAQGGADDPRREEAVAR